MFESLYSKRYRSYRLKRGETVVEFYGVTKKPWVLYQPKKRYLKIYLGLLLTRTKTTKLKLSILFLNDSFITLIVIFLDNINSSYRKWHSNHSAVWILKTFLLKWPHNTKLWLYNSAKRYGIHSSRQ